MIGSVSLKKLSEYSPKLQAAALTKAAYTFTQPTADPEEYAGRFLRILDKSNEIRPLRWNRAQRDFHTNRTGRDLVLKARQLGFSTYIQGEMFRRTVTGTRTTATMAHDDDTTQKLRAMADRFWNRYPGRQPARKYANASMTTYPEFDSTATIATAGGKQKGRGGTYSDFHGSEVAFWPDAERIVAGAMQGGNPDVILESTPNGAQGYFYERCMDALAGNGVWTLHFYPWWWDDDYRLPLHDGERIEYTDEERALVDKRGLDASQIKWRRLKQAELFGLFAQEYPEDPLTCFLTSGNSYFGDVDHAFTAPAQAMRQAGHQYAAGLDFAQTTDYTVLIVIDVTERRMVDMLRINKLDWQTQRARIGEVCKRWGCGVLAEANSIGSVNIEALNIDGIPVAPFTTTNQSKAAIMSDLHEGLHHGGLRLQDHSVIRHELRTFVSTQTASGLWQLKAEGEGHDDTVIALALAWQACARPVWGFA